MATDATVRMNVSISDHDMANLLLRACNAKWEAQTQWALVNTYLPSSMCAVLSKMEAIEHKSWKPKLFLDVIVLRMVLGLIRKCKSTSKGGQKEGISNQSLEECGLK